MFHFCDFSIINVCLFMVYTFSAVTERSHSWSYLGLPHRGTRREFHVIRPASFSLCDSCGKLL